MNQKQEVKSLIIQRAQIWQKMAPPVWAGLVVEDIFDALSEPKAFVKRGLLNAPIDEFIDD